MFVRFTFLIVLIGALASYSAQPEYLWTTMLDDSDIEYVVDAELTSSNEIVIAGWRYVFEFSVAMYTLDGQLCWKLPCPDFLDIYDILPITAPDSSIVVHGGGRDSLRYTRCLKLSRNGDVLDEICYPREHGFYVPPGMLADSADCMAGMFRGPEGSVWPIYRCMTWDGDTRWIYDYPRLGSNDVTDDVLVIGEEDFIFADQWCYNENNKAVRCPKGVRSKLTVAKITSGYRIVWRRVIETVSMARITNMIRTRAGYLLTGWTDPTGYGAPVFGAYLMQIDMNGNLMWTGEFPEEANHEDLNGPLDVVEAADGRYYLIMKYSGAFGSEAGFPIVEISGKGEELSVDYYGGGEFQPERVLRYSENRIIVTGTRGYRQHRETTPFVMLFRCQ